MNTEFIQTTYQITQSKDKSRTKSLMFQPNLQENN